MPDDLDKTAPEDPKRININQDHEVEYWCGRFRCTEQELRDAVSAVGDSAAAVKAYLLLG